jgi:putative membrane protein
MTKAVKGVRTMKSDTVCVILLGAATIFCPAVLFAQSDPLAPLPSQTQQPNRPGQTPTTLPSMQDSIGHPNETGQEMKDKMFLRKATEGGLGEVQLGKLATVKGGSQDVKDFGQKMVDDHTKLNNDMAPIADSMGVMLPKKMAKDDQAEYDKLNGMSGDDFDKEYIAYMVKDHREDLHEFRVEAVSTSDPELKAAVDKGAGVIHDHMVMADKLARAKGIPVPSHKSPPSSD